MRQRAAIFAQKGHLAIFSAFDENKKFDWIEMMKEKGSVWDR